jgi:hypothetical protein
MGIEEMLHELLWSYRQFFLPDVESDATPAADYNRYMRESEHAWSALVAAFGHKRQFRRDMLQDMADGAFEVIHAKLVEWAREIKWPRGDAGAPEGIWRSTAETADQCREKTSVFMQDSYWPFTKIIRSDKPCCHWLRRHHLLILF